MSVNQHDSTVINSNPSQEHPDKENEANWANHISFMNSPSNNLAQTLA